MNLEELIEKINFLYKKSKEEGLTEEEKQEQQVLRRDYVERVKNNFRAQMNTVEKKTPTKFKN